MCSYHTLGTWCDPGDWSSCSFAATVHDPAPVYDWLPYLPPQAAKVTVPFTNKTDLQSTQERARGSFAMALVASPTKYRINLTREEAPQHCTYPYVLRSVRVRCCCGTTLDLPKQLPAHHLRGMVMLRALSSIVCAAVCNTLPLHLPIRVDSACMDPYCCAQQGLPCWRGLQEVLAGSL